MGLTTNLLDHSFITLITNAEHKVVEKTAEEESTITKSKLEYNGFSTVEDFKKELNKELKSYLESFYDEISTIQFKVERIAFLNKIIKGLEFNKLKAFKIKGDNFIQHLNYCLDNELNDPFYSKNESSMCIDFIRVQHDYLNKCIETVQQEKKDLESLTQEDIDRIYGTSSSDVSKCIGIKKIKTSLTVEELAFFFKILEESKLFTPENGSDWGKVVVELFQTERIISISNKYFMNEYYKKIEDQEIVAEKFLLKFEKLERFIQEHLR